MYSCEFLQFSDNSVLLCIWEWSVSPLVIVSRANFTAKSFDTFMWNFCSSFIHIMMLSMMLCNPFEKHFSVARPFLVTEKSISHCQVVCFPATILVPLEIVHLLVTCSGMILPFYPWNLFFFRETETVIKQASLLELLTTKNLSALSALSCLLCYQDFKILCKFYDL